MLLAPSRFEPCGLVQLSALKYGTVPIVHETGGLADTVIDATPENLSAGLATGFRFKPLTEANLLEAVDRALSLYRDRKAWGRLMRAGMRRDWSWTASARRYVDLYERAMAKRRSEASR